MRDFINVYTIGVPRAFVKRALGVLSQLRSKDFSSGRATPSAAARPGEPDRLVSGLRRGADSWERPIEVRRSGSEPHF